ncbi:OLC1v1015988C1 [Oldenlandia corymbosa var. corymbosa]|uniref:OLC1v1015988C1 n=1 Tax=Oldenlandia corymbosa var. corymbosa TaxID=529605 RepID=A0AAV1E4S2_OLDCO|nr:OLC1v1015988C1 [Oldenlandia corymbosa var. corymbosa]
MALSLLLPIFLIFTLLLLLKWLNPGRKILRPPSPPKLPIIGNLHQLGFLPHRSLKTLSEKYGPIMLLHLGSKPTLIVSSPDVAEMVLKTHDQNFATRPKLSLVGRLVYDFKSVAFAPYGEYWRTVRRICVHQLLNPNRVQSFRSVREEEIALMLERITESCLSSSPIDIGKIFANFNNNIIDMFTGGTDTTSTLLEWVISELVKNQNCMTKLKNEVRSFVNRIVDYITEDYVDKFPYLKAVIKETLRMHPPGPLLALHESINAIEIMGYDIPAGTQVFINAYAIGRDNIVWENADEFRPERFLNNSIDVKGQHFELIPFGSGRRSCPGYGFAMITTEVVLANLMLKIDFK